jgi:hypothetical protein
VSSENKKAKDRRVEQREARRARRDKKQRFRRTILLVVAGVLGGALIIGLFLPSFTGGRNPGDGSSGGDIGQSIPILPFSPHLSPGTVNNDYNTNPPTSGRHVGQTALYGIHASPVVREQVVHNMEHGSMVIWYDTEDAEEIKQIEDFAKGLSSYPDCVIVTPWNMDSTIALTAWGKLLTLDTFDADLMQQFTNAYRGNVGPEAGVCQQGG